MSNTPDLVTVRVSITSALDRLRLVGSDYSELDLSDSDDALDHRVSDGLRDIKLDLERALNEFE